MFKTDIKKSSRRWREEGRLARKVRTQGIAHWWDPWVFFPPPIFQTEKWRSQQLGKINEHRLKSPSKSALSTQRIRKASTYQDREVIDNSCSSPAKHNRKCHALPPTHASNRSSTSTLTEWVETAWGICTFTTAQQKWSTLPLPHWGGTRGCLVKNSDFHHQAGIMRTPPTHPP